MTIKSKAEQAAIYAVSHLISLAIIALPVLAVMANYKVEEFDSIVFVGMVSGIMILTSIISQVTGLIVNKRQTPKENRDTTGEES